MERRTKSLVAAFIIPIFMAVYGGCTPTEVNTAKSVMQQASFYMQMSEQLIHVAETQFANNPKVKTALAATKSALIVARKAVSVASSGLDKDMQAVQSAVVALAIEVFALIEAIKAAKAAANSSH